MIPETLKSEIGKTFITCQTYRCDMPITACIRRQKESRQNYFATLRETLILDPGCIRCEQGSEYSGLKPLVKPEKLLSASDDVLLKLPYFRKNNQKTLEQKCSCCGEWKKMIEYYKYKDSRSTYRRMCKQCVSQSEKNRRLKVRERELSEMSIASSGKN